MSTGPWVGGFLQKIMLQRTPHQRQRQMANKLRRASVQTRLMLWVCCSQGFASCFTHWFVCGKIAPI